MQFPNPTSSLADPRLASHLEGPPPSRLDPHSYLEQSGLYLQTPASEARLPRRTGGEGLTGSIRGEITSTRKKESKSPHIMVKTPDGTREVDPYTSSKSIPLHIQPDQTRRAKAAEEANTEESINLNDAGERKRREAKARALPHAKYSSVIDRQGLSQGRRLRDADHRDKLGPEIDLRDAEKRSVPKVEASLELEGREPPRMKLDNEYDHGNEDQARTQAAKQALPTATIFSEGNGQRPAQKNAISERHQDKKSKEKELNEEERRTAYAERVATKQNGTDRRKKTEPSPSDGALTARSRNELDENTRDRDRREAKKTAMLKARLAAEEKLEEDSLEKVEETSKAPRARKDRIKETTEEQERREAKHRAILSKKAAFEQKMVENPAGQAKKISKGSKEERDMMDEERDLREARTQAILKAEAAAEQQVREAIEKKRQTTSAETRSSGDAEEPNEDAKDRDRMAAKQRTILKPRAAGEVKSEERDESAEERDQIAAKKKAILKAREAARVKSEERDEGAQERNRMLAKEKAILEARAAAKVKSEQQDESAQERDRMAAKKRAILKARAAAEVKSEEPVERKKGDNQMERREEANIDRQSRGVGDEIRAEAEKRAIIQARAAAPEAQILNDPTETNGELSQKTRVDMDRTERKRADLKTSKMEKNMDRKADDKASDISVVNQARQELEQVRTEKEQVLNALKAHESHERIEDDVRLGRKHKADESVVTSGTGKNTNKRNLDSAARERLTMKEASARKAASVDRQRVEAAKLGAHVTKSDSSTVTKEVSLAVAKREGTPADGQVMERQGSVKGRRSADDNVKLPGPVKLSREARTSSPTVKLVSHPSESSSTVMTWSKCLVSLAVCIGPSELSFISFKADIFRFG